MATFQTQKRTAMYDQKIISVLNQAEEYLNEAEEGMLKPEEDIVPYMICRNAYRSIQSYLTWFLMNRDLKYNPEITLKELLMDCRKFDGKFNDLHLDLLYDAHEKEDVWMDLAIANRFMSLARQAKALVNESI